jgi:putative aldouronate transport system permease protein
MLIKKSFADKTFVFFNTCLMVFVIFACIFPFFYVFARSASSTLAVMSGDVVFWPKEFHLENYANIIAWQGFFRSYANTILYTSVGTAFTLLVTILTAFPLSKKYFIGRKFFMVIFIVTMFFGGGLIPNFILITRLKLANSMWAIVLPPAFNHFFTILAMGSMQAIPIELEEAAAIDGMHPVMILVRIILPLCKPVMATVALFAALNFWNDWFTPMIYLHTNVLHPVMLVLRNILAGAEANMAQMGLGGAQGMMSQGRVNSIGLRNAAIIVTAVPITVIYPFVQRYFVQGMTLGSIKG